MGGVLVVETLVGDLGLDLTGLVIKAVLAGAEAGPIDVAVGVDGQYASKMLAYCDMKTLYLRNVPDEVGERLERLAAREGLSVSAFATRELSMVARRADNPVLLADLPDLGVGAASIVGALEVGRAER